MTSTKRATMCAAGILAALAVAGALALTGCGGGGHEAMKDDEG